MAVQTVTTNINVDSLVTFRSNDTLVINNGAVVTVNSNQTKSWSGITINNGKLRIENTSTVNAIRFVTARTSTEAAQAITPASGLGSIEVEGNWIEIGEGDGSANKELSIPYTDFVPALWVQTEVNGTEYEIWLNVTGVYGGSLGKFIEGFNAVSIGQRGKFFIQKPNTTQDTIITLINSTTTNTSRTITLSSTAGIFVGATITGTNIPANSVIETIVNLTDITINQACTNNASNVTVTIYNPFSQQLLPTVVFGDGTNGNILGNGIKVKIPNIMLTSDTSTKIQTLSATRGMNLNMANGGTISLNTCLLDEAYVIFTQAQTATVTDVGFTVPPAITECYDLSMNGVGYGLPPVRRYYASGWYQRDIRDTQIPFNANFINNAILNNIVIVCNQPTVVAATYTIPVGVMTLGYSDNITATNLRLYKLQQYGTGQTGLAFNGPITNSLFTNVEVYGAAPLAMFSSSDNIISNITYSISMFDAIMGWTATGRYGFNPETGANFVDDTPYYFKTRTFFTRDRSLYTESQEFSATPYLGDVTFPAYLTCYCSSNKVVTLNWPERRPTYNSPSYEIYRDTSLPITIDNAHKVFGTNTQTVIAFANGGVKPTMTSSAVRTITFNAAKTIIASSGSFITDGFLNGDTLMIVCGTSTGSKNSGIFTIASVDSATQMTVNEGLFTETAYAGGTGLTVVLTATHATNKNTITASGVRTLTFNSAKTIIASSGSFINDGYVIGDVIDISGTSANNKTSTISAITATQLTILETLVTEGTYSATATLTGRPVLNDTRYFYMLRKYNSIGVYNDSQPQEVWVHDPYIVYTQRLLQSEVLGTTWTTSNATVASNVCNSPTSLPSATVANQLTADSITATASNGYVTQTVSTIVGQDYTFSAYVATLATEVLPSVSVAGRLRLGTGETTFNATPAWQRVSVTFTAIASTTVAQIQVDTNGAKIVVAGSIVNDGAVARPPFQTTTLVAANPVDNRFPILMRPWTLSTGGETANSGIEIAFFGANPSGTIYVECYCSTVQGFIPSLANRINVVSGVGLNVISLSTNCLKNTIDGITQVGKAFESGANLLSIVVGSSDNKFLNFTMDLGFSNTRNIIYPATMSNNNLCHNWDISGYRNYSTTSLPVYGANTASGLILQNIRLDRTDFPIISTVLDVIIKGMSGANSTPAYTSTTVALGSTIDGIAVTYIAVYDSIFNELYFTETTGALYLAFNASAKVSKPYTLINGAVFLNTGKLALQTAGDGIIYTWPHKIKGVSGFRNIAPLLSGLDLGSTNTILQGLKVEYSIDGAAYKEATAANLFVESVDEIIGFNLSIRLTTMLGMKYSTQTTAFVEGETINGLTSGHTAIVDRDFDLGSTGTLWLSSATGVFTAGEIIRSGTTTRATNVATNTSFALFPSYTSYINGLQLYTNIDQTILYPSALITLSINGIITGSDVVIYAAGTTTVRQINDSISGTLQTYIYETPENIDIGIFKTGYIPYYIRNYVLALDDASLPISQIIDRAYLV